MFVLFVSTLETIASLPWVGFFPSVDLQLRGLEIVTKANIEK